MKNFQNYKIIALVWRLLFFKLKEILASPILRFIYIFIMPFSWFFIDNIFLYSCKTEVAYLFENFRNSPNIFKLIRVKYGFTSKAIRGFAMKIVILL